MERTPVMSQHSAHTGLARAHAYPCATTRGSWFVMPFIGVNTDQKPRPRRYLRIS
jgi:hypothetical protein